MIKRLTLLWRTFTPLEERLLSAVREALPLEAQRAFDAQVAAVTLVRRSPPSWNEIYFYRRRHGKSDWSAVPLFPRGDEFRLAELVFRSAGQRFKSSLTCIGGHIFDFATSPGPKAVAFAPLELSPVVTLLADPMASRSGEQTRESVPELWQQVLAADPGQWDAGWVLHDAASAYRITFDSGVHLVLAEREGEEFLLHRIDPEDAVLYHLDQHDGIPEPVQGAVGPILAGRRTTGRT